MEMDMNELAWQRFTAAMAGDDFAIPAKERDLFSHYGEEPTMLSSALTSLYHDLQHLMPCVLRAVSTPTCLNITARIREIQSVNDTVTLKFSSEWFSHLLLKVNRHCMISTIEMGDKQILYRHVTRYKREHLGDNWRNIPFDELIHHEIHLLFLEDGYWANQFTAKTA